MLAVEYGAAFAVPPFPVQVVGHGPIRLGLLFLGGVDPEETYGFLSLIYI